MNPPQNGRPQLLASDHRANVVEFLAFDHRASIVAFLTDQANALELGGQKTSATLLRAQASNVAIQMDIAAGAQGIVSPVDAIILQACAAFGGTNYREVTAPHGGNQGTKRTRLAAMWVAKKRLLGWTDDMLATHFRRDRSTVAQGIRRAEEIRGTDNAFKRITDNLVEHSMLRCEHCQHALEPA